MLYILCGILIFLLFLAFFKKSCNITENFGTQDDTYERIKLARKNLDYPSDLKNVYTKYFKQGDSLPTAINKHVIHPKVMYLDGDKKYETIKNILNKITKKTETKIIKKRNKFLSFEAVNKLARLFISDIFNKIEGGNLFKFGKTINPISRQIINNNIVKYVIPMFIYDLSGVQNPDCITKIIKGKRSNHNFLILAVLEFPINDDKIFKTIKNSIVATYLMGSLPEDQQSLPPKNFFDNVFDHDMHYSWFQEYKIMLNKETQKEILDDKENKKFLVTNWTTGKDYCKAKKISDERATPEYKAKVAAAKKAEEERLAKEAAAEKERLAKLAAAKKAEEERLAKVAAAKKAEEERLAKIAAAKKAEEERLAKIAAAKKAEEERLAKEKAAGWEIGDGKGVSAKEIYLGRSTDVYECEKLVKQKQPTANGATFGGKNKLCYAEFNMTTRNTNKKWKSKIFKGKKAVVSKSEYAKIWKDVGCTTESRYTDWVKKQTKEGLIRDSKIWATSNKEHHKKGCYGEKKTENEKYYHLPLGHNGCPESNRILDKNICLEAHKSLGLRHEQNWTGKTTGIPAGCSNRPKHTFHNWSWNTSTTGKGRIDSMPVCKRTCNETLSGNKDEGYRGCQTKTLSGRTCQAWTKSDGITPVIDTHKHSQTQKTKPGKGLGPHNYCRNPDGEKTIWCYTTDKKQRWELCKPLKKQEGFTNISNKSYNSIFNNVSLV
jgi:hypothetical protein